MLVLLSCYALVFAILKLTRQDTILDVLPLIMAVGIVCLISHVWLVAARDTVVEELSKRNPEKEFKDDSAIDYEFSADIVLWIYRIIYCSIIMLSAYLIMDVDVGKRDYFILIVPLVMLIVYDVFFYIYCIINTKSILKAIGFFFFHEARFLNKLAILMLKLMLFLIYVPILILAKIAEWIGSIL